MKTVFAVIGVIVVLGIIVVIGGGYWAYQKSGTKMIEMAQPQVEKFINEKKPSQTGANALHRIVNAAKKQKPLVAMMLVGAMAKAIEDGQVSEEEIKVLDEGSQIAESREMTTEEVTTFVEHVNQLMPEQQRPQLQR